MHLKKKTQEISLALIKSSCWTVAGTKDFAMMVRLTLAVISSGLQLSQTVLNSRLHQFIS